MSSYYTPPPQVIDGDVAFARDVNDINNETSSGFDQVESAIQNLEPTVQQWAAKAQQWATEVEDTQVEPGLYSALHWATKASDSAVAASSSASAASTSAGLASTSEANSAISAGNASTSEGNAAASEASALSHSNKAAEWAEKAEDVQVETGQYSALHWAAKAAESAASIGAPDDTAYGISWNANVDAATKNVLYDKFESLTKSDVGLANVDNTADINKPISTAQAGGLVSQTGETGAAEIPVGTTAERPLAPTTGNFRFNRDDVQFEGWDETNGWQPIAGGGGGLTWSVITTGTTGVDLNGYIADTSLGGFTLTLPLSPSVGAQVAFKDFAGTFGTSPLTIARNGQEIEGVAEDMVIDSDGFAGTLVYSGADRGWLLVTSTPFETIQSKPLMHVRETDLTGDGGGPSIIGDNHRILNDVITNEIQGASLSANTVILPAGVYYIKGHSPAWRTRYTLTKILRASDDLEYLRSSMGFSGDAGTYATVTPVAEGVITLTESTAIKLILYGSAAYVNGLGVAEANATVMGEMYIWKLDAEKEYPRVHLPVNQAVTGAYVTGGIYGGELLYNSVSTVDIKAVSCMADDLTTPLAIDAVTNVSLGTPAINTIYHIFGVKETGGTFTCMHDTDINGAGLTGIVAKRWLGFVLTDASGNIYNFVQKGDDSAFVGVVPALGTATAAYTALSLSSVLPISRLDAVTIGPTAASNFVSYDGVTASGQIYGSLAGYAKPYEVVAVDTIYVLCGVADTVDILAVKLKR